MNEGM